MKKIFTGFLSRGVGGAFAPPWLWLAPLEILFHMSVFNALDRKIILLVLSSKSYDFGVVRIKYPIASGGHSPPDPLLQEYIWSTFRLSLLAHTHHTYLKIECT